MKKILATIISVVAGATFVHAQGWIDTSAPGAGVLTNTALNAASGPGVSGKIFGGNTAAYTYDFTILFIPSSGVTNAADQATPQGSDWVQLAVDNGGVNGGSLLMTNYPSGAGGIEGQGQAGGNQFFGAGSQAYANGSSYYTELVGWSSNLGSSWSTVSGLLTDNNGVWSAGGTAGFFGYETGAFATPNGAANGASLLTLGYPNGSLTLYALQVPEPTTLALAGLGGLSMLFLRRRKS